MDLTHTNGGYEIVYDFENKMLMQGLDLDNGETHHQINLGNENMETLYELIGMVLETSEYQDKRERSV